MLKRNDKASDFISEILKSSFKNKDYIIKQVLLKLFEIPSEINLSYI